VLVAYDGGPCGRAALGFALRCTTGPLAVAHVWAPADPVELLRVSGRPLDTATLLRELGRDDQRARQEAQRVAGAGAALAQEEGRAAAAVLVAAPAATPWLEALAEWAAREAAAHLVVALQPVSRLRRLAGRDPARRLHELAPCPVTLVPTGERASAS